ncbi:MAG: aminotransferase class I/II-fold pyridoxal phosphate-dependent enzyme [Bacteroidales bacterium]|jgi:cystathionine beta-lyase/cystathionine gamma-synthase|nr:aminotransferase class I/II-fold pyridoxal phosphate-dependent enzyme [Bacteroidales bacterium]
MKRKEVNSSRIPIYRDAGFELYDAETTARAFSDETDPVQKPELYIYSRYRNPTVVAAEEEIMKLEQTSWALLTQSGMSAIDIALSIFQKGKTTSPWLFFSEIYGGTISYAESVLKNRRGLDIHSFNPVMERYDMASFESLMKKLKPEIVYFETISNPMLIVPDAAKVIKIAKKYRALVIVDNTFATPYLWRPAKYGADIVVHSATKYFSGHGNLTAGVLCGNDPHHLKAALEYRKLIGHMLSADDAYRLHTQMQTFSLRFRQQCRNAHQVADLLVKSKKISRVWYPGLKGHPSYSEAAYLFGDKGFGGMVTFDLAGKSKAEKRRRRDCFIKAVSDKIRLIPTLGDPGTILIPVESVWGARYPEPGMIRLSIGFEEYEELESTIKGALQVI